MGDISWVGSPWMWPRTHLRTHDYKNVAKCSLSDCSEHFWPHSCLYLELTACDLITQDVCWMPVALASSLLYQFLLQSSEIVKTVYEVIWKCRHVLVWFPTANSSTSPTVLCKLVLTSSNHHVIASSKPAFLDWAISTCENWFSHHPHVSNSSFQ